MLTYTHQTVGSSLAIKRWSHTSRFRMAAKLAALRPDETLLDYGTGDGTFLQTLSAPKGQTFGFEQFESLRSETADRLSAQVQIFTTHEELIGRRFDVVTCLEVLEHVPAAQVPEVLKEIRALVQPNGRVIVSVPVEIGPVSLFKNAIRFISRSSHPGASLRNITWSAVYRPDLVTREEKDGTIAGHMGFDHRVLPKLFNEAGLEIVRRAFSPVPLPTHVINSQLFYVLIPSGDT